MTGTSYSTFIIRHLSLAVRNQSYSILTLVDSIVAEFARIRESPN